MSADLFAEFNDLAKSPPPPPQQQQQCQSQQPQSQTANNDPFGFLQNSNKPAINPQPASQWPSFQAQSSDAASSWGVAAAAPPKTSTVFEEPVEEDDGWGDFEVANPAPVVAAQPPGDSAFPRAPTAWQTPAPTATVSQEPLPRKGIMRASTFDLMSNNLVDLDAQLQPQSRPTESTWGQPKESKPKPKAAWKPTPKDPNVLFDAEDFELQGGEDDEEDDDEEFGDFETVAPAASAPKPVAAKTAQPPPSLDLLSLDDPPQLSQPSAPKPITTKGPPNQLLGSLSFGATSVYPQAPKSPSFQERNPFPELGVKTGKVAEPGKSDKPKSASPITAWPSYDERLDKNGETYKDDYDEWTAWDDNPGSGNNTADIDSAKPPESWAWDAVDNVKPSAPPAKKDDAPPPINVPPPSIILSVFPDLLNSGSALFRPMSGQSASIKEQIISDPKAVDFLQGYILLAVTAARVIAGRKQRWHRDKILAKSMSISAAGSKGMKLAGVDKTQSTREDREAADVVAVWKQHVGRLRSAVAVAKAAGKATLKVPELSETMQVQTAKMVPTAPKPCVICGLKREERVAKVDFDVEDSFGEWWAEHWGHKACKNFWLEHEQKLRQR